jgi:hypothetical protein
LDGDEWSVPMEMIIEYRCDMNPVRRSGFERSDTELRCRLGEVG